MGKDIYRGVCNRTYYIWFNSNTCRNRETIKMWIISFMKKSNRIGFSFSSGTSFFFVRIFVKGSRDDHERNLIMEVRSITTVNSTWLTNCIKLLTGFHRVVFFQFLSVVLANRNDLYYLWVHPLTTISLSTKANMVGFALIIRIFTCGAFFLLAGADTVGHLCSRLIQ